MTTTEMTAAETRLATASVIAHRAAALRDLVAAMQSDCLGVVHIQVAPTSTVDTIVDIGDLN